MLYTSQIIALGIVLCDLFSLEPFVDCSGPKTLLFQEMETSLSEWGNAGNNI
jgi:hypothetical protein